MIELTHDTLVFSFPEVHEDAELWVNFQRTLRIPDDGRDYPLPPGRGCFPLRHVDDVAERVPDQWLRHGGVVLPMYQAEAMWLLFHSPTGYPFAIKVAAGKINAVTGKPWEDGLGQDPQNYMVHPVQPWLDGYVVNRGEVRQFVAMPLGAGYSTEEQLTGRAEFGGLQIQAFPLCAERWVPPRPISFKSRSCEALAMEAPAAACAPDMALGMGGSMKQEVYRDHRPLEHWDAAHGSRCFVHLANSMVWREITGSEPPTAPPAAADYNWCGLPWFDEYVEGNAAVPGSDTLGALKSVAQLAAEKGEVLPDNDSFTPRNVVGLHEPPPRQVREGRF